MFACTFNYLIFNAEVRAGKTGIVITLYLG